MRSYRPEELFDQTGALLPELAKLSPKKERRMNANDLSLSDFRTYAV